MLALETRDLRFAYPGGAIAVDAVSLALRAGEVVTIVGPSGCGKTTLLRLIAGLERPSAGEVRIMGEPARSLAPNQRRLGFVFQDGALYPHLSVRDNIALGLEARRLPRRDADDRLRAVASMTGIAALLDRTPETLSGGERQRVALARAIAPAPAILLLDEPLAGIDARLRDDLIDELRAVYRDTGAAVLHVTHDQDEALALGDRVGVMNAGRIEQVGTSAEILDRPANEFVAAFVGRPRLTLIRGVIEPSATAHEFVAGVVRAPAGGLRPGPATLGLRAQDVDLTPPDRGAWGAVVESVTRTAQGWLVRARVGDHRVAAVTPRELRLAPADPVGVSPRWGALLYFDADGRRLVPPTEVTP